MGNLGLILVLVAVSLWLYCFYKALRDWKRVWKDYDKALKDAGYV